MSASTHLSRSALVALGLIHAFGVNSMYGLVYRNGYIDALIHLRDHGPHLLPGSDIPILTKFTGIGPPFYAFSHSNKWQSCNLLVWRYSPDDNEPRKLSGTRVQAPPYSHSAPGMSQGGFTLNCGQATAGKKDTIQSSIRLDSPANEIAAFVNQGYATSAQN